MRHSLFVVSVCGLLLAGCADPLAGFDRLDEIDVSEDTRGAAALPSAEEVVREGFLGTTAAQPAPPPQDAADTDRTGQGGLWALFRRTQEGGQTGVEADAEDVTAADIEADGAAVETAQTEDAKPDAPAVETAAAPAERTGFLARLLRAPDAPDAQADAPEVSAPQVSAPQEEAATATLAAATPQQPVQRPGLFGRLTRPAAAAPQATEGNEIAYGTLLPFGEVVRVCAARGKPLGRRVEKAPAPGYELFDSQPGSAVPRSFYITGFRDGCPRQLTAANVLLGSASLYERLHYGPGGDHLPKGATDQAYETLKRRICGTGRRKPCGGAIKKVDRTTFFVSAYAQFGQANRWSEALVHDGAVVATAVKQIN